MRGGGWSHLPEPTAGERLGSPGDAWGREREAERGCAKGGPAGTSGRVRMSVSPGPGRLWLRGGAAGIPVAHGSAAASSAARGRSPAPVAGGGRRACRGLLLTQPRRPRPHCLRPRRCIERGVPVTRPFHSCLISKKVRSE